MNPPTTKELEMYTYIKSYALQKGYLPSIRDIAEGLGYKSTATVHIRMQKLEYKGYIVLSEAHEPRAYRVKGLRYMDESRI